MKNFLIISFVSVFTIFSFLLEPTNLEASELVFATKVDTPSLDPYNDVSDARMRRSLLMYDCLLEWTNDFGVAPGLAKKWEYDGNVLSFHLRENVLFHDGSLMTSADVVYSLKKVLKSPGS